MSAGELESPRTSGVYLCVCVCSHSGKGYKILVASASSLKSICSHVYRSKLVGQFSRNEAASGDDSDKKSASEARDSDTER